MNGNGTSDSSIPECSAFVTPADVPHSWKVLGETPSQVVCVTAPPEPESEPGEK